MDKIPKIGNRNVENPHREDGHKHMREGKFNDAIKSYESALNIEPNNDEIYSCIGYAYYEKKIC